MCLKRGEAGLAVRLGRWLEVVIGGVVFAHVTQAVMQVIVGTILNAGVPCPDLRLDTGEIVTIQGVPSHVRTGDRISITGRTRHSFSCMKEVFAAAEVTVVTDTAEAPPSR